MVIGIDKFRDHFAGYEDQYALIGGAACDLIFTDAGLEFRSTQDLDVVLCVEVMDKRFAQAFQGFLEAGGYEARQKSDGRKAFYRFLDPADGSYPKMVELFSRQPGGFVLHDESSLARVPVDEGILSLSAILLDEDYYNALQDYRTVREGISLLDAEMLIPFKAKAFLNLTQRKIDGESVHSDDIKKHRNDVFRLVQLLRPDHRISLADTIINDLCKFLDSVRNDETLNPKTFKVHMSRAEGIALLEDVYGLRTPAADPPMPAP